MTREYKEFLEYCRTGRHKGLVVPGSTTPPKTTGGAQQSILSYLHKFESMGCTGGMTGYLRFCQEMRPVLRKADPDISFCDMGKRLGEEWRALSDEEKETYSS
jgi:hypothetical protein